MYTYTTICSENTSHHIELSALLDDNGYTMPSMMIWLDNNKNNGEILFEADSDLFLSSLYKHLLSAVKTSDYSHILYLMNDQNDDAFIIDDISEVIDMFNLAFKLKIISNE